MSETTWTDEQLREAVMSSKSILETMRKIGVSSGSYRRIRNHIIRIGIDPKIAFPRPKSIPHSKYTLDEIFCIDSKIARSSIREHVLKRNLIFYKCAECSLTNSYNGKYLALQLDHINGISNDNRLENLRWLCPNCHSQTNTFAGKNLPKKGRKPYHKKGFAKERLNRRKIDFERARKLYFELGNYSLVGRELGVSDTCIRRAIKMSRAGWI